MLMTYASFDLCAQVFFEVIEEPSIKEPTSVLQLDVEPYWIDLLASYLHDRTLSMDQNEAKNIQHQASRFILYEDKLYERSFSLPLLECLKSSQVEYALQEDHEGIYISHLGYRALFYKILKDTTSPPCNKMPCIWLGSVTSASNTQMYSDSWLHH